MRAALGCGSLCRRMPRATGRGFFLACGGSSRQRDWPEVAFPSPSFGVIRMNIPALQVNSNPSNRMLALKGDSV